MQQLHLTGDVVPPNWFDSITYRNKRGLYPHNLAILILADTCYWYKPKEIRDEKTSKVVRYEKRFSGEKLQRSYSQICDKYGCTEPQAREAVALLEARELITKEYIHHPGGRRNWQMFIEPNLEKVREYTFEHGRERFDFIIKRGRKFIWVEAEAAQDCELANSVEAQDCELANSQKTGDCELANPGQDGQLATTKMANSQSSIYTEITLTKTILSDKEAETASPFAGQVEEEVEGAAAEAAEVQTTKNGKPRPEIHLAIDAFLKVREEWLQRRNPGREIDPDEVAIHWSGKERQQLINIGKAIKAKARKKKYEFQDGEDYVENLLVPFLTRYAGLQEWYSDKFTPSNISTHFNAIYDDIKAGKDRKRTDPNSATSAAGYREALAVALAQL